jgi:hypothetical protein
MAKDESPSDLTKLPHVNLFSDGISKGNDAFDDKRNVKSSQNNKMLDYFNALSDAEHESILGNLHADKEQEQFMRDETSFRLHTLSRLNLRLKKSRRLNSMTT